MSEFNPFYLSKDPDIESQLVPSRMSNPTITFIRAEDGLHSMFTSKYGRTRSVNGEWIRVTSLLLQIVRGNEDHEKIQKLDDPKVQILDRSQLERYYPAGRFGSMSKRGLRKPSGLCMIKFPELVTPYGLDLLKKHKSLFALFRSVTGSYIGLFRIPPVKSLKEYKSFHAALCMDLHLFEPNIFENSLTNYFYSTTDHHLHYNLKPAPWTIQIDPREPKDLFTRMIYLKACVKGWTDKKTMYNLSEQLIKLGYSKTTRRRILKREFDPNYKDLYHAAESIELYI